MRTLHRTVLQDADSAPAIPNMFPSLEERQVAIRRGEVSMIAGQAGSGKSSLALALCKRSKVPTMYFSADTNAHTVQVRLTAMTLDTEMSVIEPAIAQDREWAAEVLKQHEHIKWSFDSSISVQKIERNLEAIIELTSRPPELVVIDNLLDCVTGGSNRWDGMVDLLLDFKTLARDYDTAFLVLHHMGHNERIPAGQVPPEHAIKGKLTDTPALILSVGVDPSGFMGISPLKNRSGKPDKFGETPTWLRYEPSRMLIEEVEPAFNV